MKFINDITMGTNPTIVGIKCETQFERMTLTKIVNSHCGNLCVSLLREGGYNNNDVNGLIVYKRIPKSKNEE